MLVNKNAGFTLLGLLIATGMIMIAMLAVMALTMRVVNVSAETKDHFIATGLAREGIEYVRFLRDSNYYNYDPTLDSSIANTEIYWRGIRNATDCYPGVDPLDHRVDCGKLIQYRICGNSSAPGIFRTDSQMIKFSNPSLEAIDPFDTNATRLGLFNNLWYTHYSPVTSNVQPTVPEFHRTITITSPDDKDCSVPHRVNDPSTPNSLHWFIIVTSRVWWMNRSGVQQEVSLTQFLFPIKRVR